MKRLAEFTAVIMSACMLISGCGKSAKAPVKTEEPTVEQKTSKPAENDLTGLTENAVEVDIKLTNGEDIELELYPDIAPKTVANFVKNVQEGYYSGTIFHRVIDGFMIQGGGYDEEYNLKPVSETVEGEFEENGFDNPLSHTRGVISMARAKDMNSATTQFFIVQEDSTYLDGQYAAFGRVVDGMDVVDEIATAKKASEPPAPGMTDATETTYVIDSITIDTADGDKNNKEND